MDTNQLKSFLINVATGMYGASKITRQQADQFANKAEQGNWLEVQNYYNDWRRRDMPPYEREMFDLENYVLGVCFS